MSHILLIEDDRGMARGLRYNLEAEGCVVVHAATGSAGLAAALTERFDLILLDVMLPELSGFEVLERLRRGGDATPVILLSARANEHDRIRGLELGADDFVAKPFALGELLTRIRKRVRAARRMAVLHGAITSSSDLDALLDSALDLTGAERGLLLVDDGRGELVLEAARGRDSVQRPVRYCRSVARRVFETGTAEALLEADRDWKDGDGSVLELKLRRVLCAPLSRAGRTFGVLYADSRMRLESWGRRDVELFESLASQCGLALDRARAGRLEKELNAAGRTQQAMQARPPAGGAVAVDIAGLINPLEPAGGDYVDYVTDPRDDGRLALVMGDAAGHGVAAALCMSAARSLVRTFLPRRDDPGAVLAEVNHGLARDMAPGNFMSMLLAEVDTATGALRYASAGHTGFVFRAAAGVCETLEATGPALGILDPARFDVVGVAPLGRHDVLVLYTDGISEARSASRELFGVERLEAIVRAAHREDGAAIVARVADAVRTFAGARGPGDDVSLVIVKGTAAAAMVA